MTTGDGRYKVAFEDAYAPKIHSVIFRKIHDYAAQKGVDLGYIGQYPASDGGTRKVVFVFSACAQNSQRPDPDGGEIADIIKCGIVATGSAIKDVVCDDKGRYVVTGLQPGLAVS